MYLIRTRIFQHILRFDEICYVGEQRTVNCYLFLVQYAFVEVAQRIFNCGKIQIACLLQIKY